MTQVDRKPDVGTPIVLSEDTFRPTLFGEPQHVPPWKAEVFVDAAKVVAGVRVDEITGEERRAYFASGRRFEVDVYPLLQMSYASMDAWRAYTCRVGELTLERATVVSEPIIARNTRSSYSRLRRPR